MAIQSKSATLLFGIANQHLFKCCLFFCDGISAQKFQKFCMPQKCKLQGPHSKFLASRRFWVKIIDSPDIPSGGPIICIFGVYSKFLSQLLTQAKIRYKLKDGDVRFQRKRSPKWLDDQRKFCNSDHILQYHPFRHAKITSLLTTKNRIFCKLWSRVKNVLFRKIELKSGSFRKKIIVESELILDWKRCKIFCLSKLLGLFPLLRSFSLLPTFFSRKIRGRCAAPPLPKTTKIIKN